MAFTTIYASCVVQSALFSGYNVTGHSGVITKMKPITGRESEAEAEAEGEGEGEGEYAAGYQLPPSPKRKTFMSKLVQVKPQGQKAAKARVTPQLLRSHDWDEPRHIVSINHQPAAEVYNKWTGNTMLPYMKEEGSEMLKRTGSTLILAPSSLFPLGQVSGARLWLQPNA